MKTIERNINELVLRIKEEQALCDCCFVRGFSAKEHSNPMSAYTVAVAIHDAQLGTQFVGEAVDRDAQGGVCEVTVIFRVYAPKNDGGDGLLSLCSALTNAIKDNDVDNACVDIRISGIDFDNDALTVYRDVTAQMEYCLYEEVTR